MISDDDNKAKAGFTLVEAVMSIAILAVTMATMATMLRYSDNAAAQARLESTALLEFSRQCNWLVNVPMSSFKDSITNYMSATGKSWPLTGNNAIVVSSGTADNYACGLLYEPPGGADYPPKYYLMKTASSGAFPYTITLKLDKSSPAGAVSGPEAVDSFSVDLSMTYSPPTLLIQTPGTNSPAKTLNFLFEKW